MQMSEYMESPKAYGYFSHYEKYRFPFLSRKETYSHIPYLIKSEGKSVKKCEYILIQFPSLEQIHPQHPVVME